MDDVNRTDSPLSCCSSGSWVLPSTCDPFKQYSKDHFTLKKPGLLSTKSEGDEHELVLLADVPTSFQDEAIWSDGEKFEKPTTTNQGYNLIEFPTSKEAGFFDFLTKTKVKLPIMMASNVVILALGFFIGRRSVGIDVAITVIS